MKREFFRSGACVPLDKNRYLLGWGEVQSFSSPPEDNLPFFFFHTFFLNKSFSYHRFAHWDFVSKEELQNRLIHTSVPPSSPTWMPPSTSFFDQFDSLQKRIESGELIKGVPHAFVHSQDRMTISRLAQTWRKAIEFQGRTDTFLYGFWNSSQGILGCTPEILFHQHRNLISTHALAGTIPSSEPDEALLGDIKQRREHQWVVDGIQQSLVPYGPVKIGETSVVRAGALSHLMTPIECRCRDMISIESLLSSLHPTPSLGCFPKDRGAEWLMSCEDKEPRGYFGAPFGCCDPQSSTMAAYVAIRNVQWSAEGMRIGAGCGVIQESSKEQEWTEWQSKIRSIQRAFSL